MKIQLKEDQLNSGEIKELNDTGRVSAEVSRFMVISGMSCAAIGRALPPTKNGDIRGKEVMHYHKRQRNVIQYTADTGEIQLFTKQREVG